MEGVAFRFRGFIWRFMARSSFSHSKRRGRKRRAKAAHSRQLVPWLEHQSGTWGTLL